MKKSIGVSVLLLAVGGACLAQSQEPSLGDLAKKQGHAEKKPAKVFTNEDVAGRSSDPGPEPVRQSSAPAFANASPAASGESKPEKKKESAGKEAASSKDSPEVAELKQKITTYKEEQEGWKKSAKRYQDLLATETSEFRRQMYQDALQGDQNNIQIFQNKIDQAQADLAKAEKPQGH
jgi:hypothetical protein